ncbi:MAG: SNF2-related protein, partial [Leptospiraceae bacterium]|nr:SNF2-related protein [Leptospiraceae bacterium]
MQGLLLFSDKNVAEPCWPSQPFLLSDAAGEKLVAEIKLKQPETKQKSCQLDGLYLQLWALLENYYREPWSVFAASRTMLLPHQVEATLRVVSASRPRFLIADEVGLGKTIEAGLILKELKLKHGYRRILVVVPAPLLAQWQQELKNKFAEDFQILNSALLRQSGALEENGQFLVSVDLAKDERYRWLFTAVFWDLVIFDEAHRLRRDAHNVTLAWQFAHEVCQKAEGVLLLSATPFRGKLEEIFYLIQLLDPDILGPFAVFQEQFAKDASLLRERLAPVLIRRRKVDVGGFTKRFAKTVKIRLSSAEREFYDKTTEYVRTEFNRALSRGENLKSFIMIVFQKLLDSSPFALLKALESRRARLESCYFRLRHDNSEFPDVAEAIREYQEEEGFNLEEIPNPEELLTEIQHLRYLIQLGQKITDDSKLRQLKKTLKAMQKAGHRKFVIFTQFQTTLEYLASQLKEYRVATFHGSLNFAQKEQAVCDFFNDAEIFISTEAGGEGRNLQVAACLINYDLPWSPLKLEQRIGRIHRFGQTRDVHIVNFACRDTVAERVLEILEQKIRIFENALGPSDTLLGAFESEAKFARSLMAFLSSRKSKKEKNQELERSLKLAQENLQYLDHLLSPEHMHFNLAAFRHAINPEKIEKSGTALENLLTNYAIKKQITWQKEGKIVSLSLPKNGVANTLRGTFDHDVATQRPDLEFFALGHPFVEECLHTISQEAESCPYVRIPSPQK